MPKEVTPLAVLVIDDEPLIRWAVLEALSGAGHAVVEAPDGAAGLSAVVAAARPFDVIFLDFRLPDSNDFTLLSAMRMWAPQSIVVLMTASGMPEVATEAYRLGVYRVLVKPFDIGDVHNIVTAARNPRGDFYGSTRDQRFPVSMSMDFNRDGNAAGTVDVRDLSALP